tara:strand:- start:1866 stop:2114 length:249 start_codon:yes stop_codon:yes gene_type:complete
MISMNNIDNLIQEVSRLHTWEDNVSKDCKEFLDLLKKHVRNGNNINATSFQTVLEREYNVKVSNATANRWVKNQLKEANVDE